MTTRIHTPLTAAGRFLIGFFASAEARETISVPT